MQNYTSLQEASRPVVRPIARLVIAAHLLLALQPLSVLAQERQQSMAPSAPLLALPTAKAAQSSGALNQTLSDADLAQSRIERVAGILKTLYPEASQNSAASAAGRQSQSVASADVVSRPTTIAAARPALSAQRSAELKGTLRQLLYDTQSAQRVIADDMRSARQQLQDLSKSGKLSPEAGNELLNRHDAAQQQLDAKAGQFTQLAAAAANNPTDANAYALAQHMAQYPGAGTGKTHVPTDPANLPWGAAKPVKRNPAETKTAWFQNLYADRRVRLAQAGGTSIGGVQFNIPPEPTQAPNEADLTAGDEIQITPAIQAKAAELGNNPVNISNWVRNNIQFLPTWGAIQGADYTLLTLRGNAIDTASLLISLLRAAKIPARYQFGTVDIAADKVQNWVGGVTTPEAALNLLNQGGIAARGVIQAGRIQTIRMEHVWVTAYVNWVPSRGGRQGGSATQPATLVNGLPQHVNPNGPLNAWVSMDASFKMYEAQSKLSLIATNTASCIQLFNTFNSATTATSDRIQLSPAAFDPSRKEDCDREITNALRVQAVDPQRILRPNIIAGNPALLAGTLPHSLAFPGAQVTTLPSSLRWRLEVGLYDSSEDLTNDNPSVVQYLNMFDVAGKRLALTYLPASPSDAAVLNDLRTSNASSLPAYLISVIPSLMLNDQPLAVGNAKRMGLTQYIRLNIVDAANQQSYPSNAKTTLGDDTALVLNPSGVTDSFVQARFAMAGSNTSLENLNTVGLNYWLMVDAAEAFAANARQLAAVRMPSIGLFGSPLNVRYFFGIARSGTYGSRYADVKMKMVAASGDQAANAAFLMQAGFQGSNFEALTFEKTFQKEAGTNYSAVRLISIAASQGIPILKIDAANANLVNVLQISEDAKIDIANAIAMGKYAIVSEREPALTGMAAVGYILLDPIDGSGAYLIDGGLNGDVDPGDCGPGSASAPVTDNVSQVNVGLGIVGAIALVALVLWSRSVLIEALVVAAMVMVPSGLALATVPPVGGLAPELQQIWQSTWAPAYGNFPQSGPLLGDGMDPPGKCTQPQYDSLASTKGEACGKSFSCNGSDCDQGVIQQKVNLRNACIAARLEIMVTCFNGGDAAHWGQVQEQLKGVKKCQNCLSRVLQNQCKKP